jgi:cytochrome o ubiquinol oxidase subunit 3
MMEKEDTTIFGFWVYLMTDLVMFAALFATYAVLHTSTFGGPTGRDLFNLQFVLTETIILLTSSFTMGLAVLATKTNQVKKAITWLAVTFLLGAGFLGMELNEFANLIHKGASYTRSAFLSSYFALVGTHGLHIAIGLLWIIISIIYIKRRGLTGHTARNLTLLSLFWHFLDIVWICIFTIVYLMGAL